MLKPGTLHKKLPVVTSPEGTFYTPTFEDYGSALAALLTRKNLYLFQRVIPYTRPRAWLFYKAIGRACMWQATTETKEFDDFPQGWEILKGRSYRTPKSLTVKEAREIRNQHIPIGGSAGVP